MFYFRHYCLSLDTNVCFWGKGIIPHKKSFEVGFSLTLIIEASNTLSTSQNSFHSLFVQIRINPFMTNASTQLGWQELRLRFTSHLEENSMILKNE